MPNLLVSRPRECFHCILIACSSHSTINTQAVDPTVDLALGEVPDSSFSLIRAD